MGAVLLSPLYILLNAYLILRMLRWFSTLSSFLGSPWFVIPFLTCYALTALTPLFASLLRGGKPGGGKTRRIGDAGMQQTENAEMQQSESAKMQQSGNAETRRTGYAGMRRTENAETRQTENAGMQRSESAETRQTENAGMQQSESAETRRTGDAEMQQPGDGEAVRFGQKRPGKKLRRLPGAVSRISNYWLGTLMYLLIYLLLADLGRILLRLFQRRSLWSQFGTANYRIAGGIVFAATALTSLYGILHVSHIKKTRYDVTIEKNCPLPSLKIALVADLHLGHSIGLRHIKKVKKLIQETHPDLILFAGDIFDNDFDAIQEPEAIAALFSSLKSTYGSFACWGNHDVDEQILAGFTFRSKDSVALCDPRMDQFLKDSGIRLLSDETLLIDNAFYLIGRLDASCEEKSKTARLAPSDLTSGLNKSLPILVVDHQPSQLEELSQAGVDLDLSGHTHDGQLFPGSLTTRIGWKNSCGKLQVGSMTSIVTSGAGIWGPAMRVGTDNEVVEITVTFRG